VVIRGVCQATRRRAIKRLEALRVEAKERTSAPRVWSRAISRRDPGDRHAEFMHAVRGCLVLGVIVWIGS